MGPCQTGRFPHYPAPQAAEPGRPFLGDGAWRKGKKAPAKAENMPLPKVSPLAPKSFAHLPPLAGVRLATGEAGIKYRNRTDVLLAILAPGTEVAGVFTRSKTASAPVEWCRAAAASAARPAPWWSIAATPMPSPARPAWQARARWPKRPAR